LSPFLASNMWYRFSQALLYATAFLTPYWPSYTLLCELVFLLKSTISYISRSHLFLIDFLLSHSAQLSSLDLTTTRFQNSQDFFCLDPNALCHWFLHSVYVVFLLPGPSSLIFSNNLGHVFFDLFCLNLFVKLPMDLF